MKPLLSICLVLLTLLCRAQEGNLVYVDSEGKPVKNKRKAVLLQQHLRINDTIWEFNNYRPEGACINSCRCRNEQCAMLDGRFISYDLFGFCDTVGNYVRDRREGVWRVYSQAGRLVSELTYQDDVLIDQRDSTKINAENKQRHDSLYAGRTVIEVESNFPGGTREWLNFINHHLRYPDEAVDDGLRGTPIVGFVVDKDGHIPRDQIYMARSVAYVLDKAALQVILQSPDWIPAIQDGRKVASHKKQPFVFQLNGR
jgi:TonB family protein